MTDPGQSETQPDPQSVDGGQAHHPFQAADSFAPPPATPPPGRPASAPPPSAWAAPATGPQGAGPTLPPPAPETLLYPSMAPVVAAPQLLIRWGMGQMWLGLGLALGLNVVVSIIGMVIWLAANGGLLANGDIQGATEKILNDLSSSPLFLGASLLTLWAGFLTGVFVASYRKGQRSLAKDFGWRIVWRTDIALGVGLAVLLRLADAGFGWLLQALGVNPSNVDNSGPIVNQTGVALIVFGLAAAVGAPIVEELFFRGLALRAIQRRFGAIVGIIGSSVLFGLLHAQPDKSGALGFSSLWLVLFTGSLGAVLAIVAVKTKRLGITVVAHMTFNASALVLAVLLK